MRAALLARVSTKDQHSIPMQLEAMRNYCKQREWEIVKEVEESQSGKAAKRPGRDEIMTLAKKRKIDVVIVWKLNRWGRSTVDLLLTLHELQSLGVSFVSISEHMDLTTPMGRMMAGILAVFAEFEREVIVENVKAGIVAYRAKHKKWGRPPRAQMKKERVQQLKDAGLKPDQIARELAISRAAVYRLLQLV